MLKNFIDYHSAFKDKNVENNLCSDINTAELFFELHRHCICYIKESRSWYIYDGQRWLKDDGGFVMELCKDFVRTLVKYAQSLVVDIFEELKKNKKNAGNAEEDNQEFLGFYAYVKEFHKRSRRTSLIADASSIAPRSLNDFDKNPLLFNCQNGTFDLNTMTFRQYDSNDFLTKLANVQYDKNAICDRWIRFIDEVMCGDKENARFTQKAFGYSLSGLTMLECMFILYGPKTRNGKSTMTETIAELFDEYAMTIQPQSLAKRNTNGAAPSPDIAKLKGARFVNVPEPAKGMEFDSAFVKQLTGGDAVTGRLLFQNPIEFRPEFKIFMNTNHLPKISDKTILTSGRIKVIPFERHFLPDEQDHGLKQELRKPENLSGILNWLIEGYRMMQSEGLTIPEKISDATDDYQNNATADIETFFGENLVVSETDRDRVKTSELYERYKVWAKDNDIIAMRIQDMIAELRHFKYIINRDGTKGNQLVGVKLKV